MENKGQKLTVLNGMTLRDLIQSANRLEIRKEDIVTVLKEQEEFRLIYFK